MNVNEGSSFREVTRARLSMRALGLVFCLPFVGLMYYLVFLAQGSSPRDWSLTLPLVASGVVALLGLYFILEILKGIDRLSGKIESVSDASPESGIMEVSQTLDGLCRLTADLGENSKKLDTLVCQLSTLTEITELAARVPDLNELLGVVLRKAMMATQATKGSVMLRREDRAGLEVVASEGWSPNLTGPIDPQESFAGRVIETGQPFLAHDISDATGGERPNDGANFSSPSFLIMPLNTTRATIGSLCLSEKRDGSAFGAHDQQFLAVLLGQVRFAFENARLLEESRDAAKALRETVHSQEIQLASARRKILQADRLSVLGQLVASVAHQINNPLTSALGYAQLLLERTPAGSDAKWLKTVFEESNRAAKITQNLLSFAHESKPGRSPADINHLVQNVVDLRCYDLRMRDIDISTDLAAGLPVTMADPGRIQQVLLNLINNSAQAMTSKNPRKIRIGTSHANGEILMWIADTGQGIPETLRERIFDPFFSTKAGTSHTGLGLTIARGIIEDHDGSMDLVSVEGQGTRLTMHLPVVEAPAEMLEVQPFNLDTVRRFDNLYALSIDDEPANADLVASILEDIGFRVEVSTAGPEAMQRLLHESFDLVVCDVRMPQLDGRTLYRNLRKSKPRAARRILFTTGDAADPEVILFAQNNGLRLIAKPFVKEDILQAVHEAFAPAAAPVPSPASARRA
jgi:signal transduction histidine kinase/ActR/RegA family two-component response regulator